MKLVNFIGTNEIAFVCLCALLVFLGIATARVGLYGRFLGRLKLVSYVQKYPDQPRWHHRLITAGTGILFVIFGVAMLILRFYYF